MKSFDATAINLIRQKMGLPLLKPGLATCLSCEQVFQSWDIKSNRICGPCTKDTSRYEEDDEDYLDDDDEVFLDADYWLFCNEDNDEVIERYVGILSTNGQNF